MTFTKSKIYMLKPALSLGVIIWGALACHEVIKTNSTPLSLDLSACLNSLIFERPEQSCAQGVGAEPRGCFLMRQGEEQTSSVLVQLSLEGSLEVADEHSAQLLTSIDSIDEEATEGALIFFVEGASFDCETFTLEESCEGDCVVKANFLLREEGGGEGRIVSGISESDEEELCAWRLPGPPAEERCDGLDNDCDGEVDESPEHTIGAECHNGELGQCRVEGVKGCDEAGGWVCLYETDELVEPEDERCDGLDNDCDGELDESFPEQGQGCERGEGLNATGAWICQEGQLLCSAEESCDEVDNDLDGLVDEGFEVGESCTPEELSCYSRTGQIKCVTPERLPLRIGELGGAGCFPDEITRVEEGSEDCDGLDNDCDGFTDEGFIEQVISCGVGVCENTDGRLRCIEGATVNDCDPLPVMSIDDDCNGQDNDCDGLADEGFISYPMPCEGLVGECSRQTRVFCVNRQLQYSCPEVTPPQEEDLRCDGLDEDCDGLVDESFVPKEVSCGLGVCEQTVWSTCEAGVELRSCVPGEPLGVDDTCDGFDDDCDGRSDESYSPQPYSCFAGECQQSYMTRCINQDGSVMELTSCPETSLILPQAEVCDGLDNDCDGVVDDEIAEQPTSCGLGICAATGSISCTEGELIDSCSPSLPVEGVADDCDGLDNDCDGNIDEDFISEEDIVCEQGGCQEFGSISCLNGVEFNSCETPLDNENPETECDGIDQDCDQKIDEGFIIESTQCGTSICASTGFRICQNGRILDTCQALPGTADNSCDGIDQDCDDKIDESFGSVSVTCGQGACESFGTRSCDRGEVVNTCLPGTPEDDINCDLIDNDCDGLIDEGYPSSSVTCGEGACLNTGLKYCGPNGIQEACVPLTPGASDTSCDGIDQDCDGVADEGYVGPFVTCGIGVCVNSQRKECLSGNVVDVCQPLAVQGDDTDCNQRDDDCDASLDEGFVGALEDCGAGACEPSAQMICTQSGIISTCSYQMNIEDSSCNGVDEDCDGLIDEDYTAPVITELCGLGVCEAEAEIQCINGSAQVICVPGQPQPDDNCDGLDNDCDGSIDEAFSITFNCGQGVCARSITVGCDQGQDACVPGVEGVELCGDGLDNDCDGQEDEGFEALDTQCSVGIGACERVGLWECQIQDLSEPLQCSVAEGLSSDELCNSVDDDCDGSIDEEIIGVGDTCYFPQYVNTSCHQGTRVCVDGGLACEALIQPGDLEENYCTAIDEDCLPATSSLNYEEIESDVPFEGELYDIRLGDVCRDRGNKTDCLWGCYYTGGVPTLECYRDNYKLCTPNVATSN